MSRRSFEIRHATPAWRRHLTRAVGAGLFVTIVVLLVTRMNSFESPTPNLPEIAVPAIPDSDEYLQPLDENERSISEKDSVVVSVYLDGWSMKILNRSVISATLENGMTAALNFMPLDGDAIDEATLEHPEIVTSAMARLVSADQRLVCTDGKCTIGKKRIDHRLLVTPEKIPAFGVMYDAWGIEHGLYRAQLRVPKIPGVVTLSADGWSGTQIIAGELFGEGGRPLTPITAGPDQGWGRGSYGLAAGYGRIFIARAGWITENGETVNPVRWLPRDFVGTGENASGPAELAAEDPLSAGPAGRDGLAMTGSAGLNEWQLTYLSSPVTGCGTVAVCTPVPVEVEREVEKTTSTLACDAQGQKVVSVSVRSRWSFTLEHPAHLLGAWGADADPRAFPGSGDMESVLTYLGEPPLANGRIELDQITLYLVDDAGLSWVGGVRYQKKGALPDLDATMLEKLYGDVVTACR